MNPTTPKLDPNPKNDLGKGVFTPEREAELLAQGYVFARYWPPTKRLPFGTTSVSKRFIADAVTDMALDDRRTPHHLLSATT